MGDDGIGAFASRGADSRYRLVGPVGAPEVASTTALPIDAFQPYGPPV